MLSPAPKFAFAFQDAMKKSLIISIAYILPGLIITAWPDENWPPVIGFSKEHGPSLLDLFGLSFILRGYLILGLAIFRTPRDYGKSRKKILMYSNVFLAGVAAGLTFESDLLLWSSAGLCIALQSYASSWFFRKHKETTGN
jgi:hypothetical protein